MGLEDQLDFAIRHDLNVLLSGHAGCGKSTVVIAAFERAGLKWKYFSASLCDPFTELLGVPKEQKDDKGNSYLGFVLPKEFQDDSVEAIFLDELNRGSKRIRNAVLELVLYHSVGGRKLKNLKCVWAAINPDDDETYDVERLDPAQADRFHMKIELPYKPHKPYFTSKYGETMANAAIAWWHELPPEVKKEVSPRRLDYALDIYGKNGDIRFVLPEKSNISKLITTLRTGPIADQLTDLFKRGDAVKARQFLTDENNYAAALGHLTNKRHRDWWPFFLPLLPNEKVSALMAAEHAIASFVIDHVALGSFAQLVKDVIEADQNHNLPGVLTCETQPQAGHEKTPRSSFAPQAEHVLTPQIRVATISLRPTPVLTSVSSYEMKEES